MNDVAVVRFPSLPGAMKALDKLEADIRKTPSFEALNMLSLVARDLQRRWRPVKEVADRAGECWVAAETKLGEELQRTPKATGTRGQLNGGKKGTGRGTRKTGEAVLEPPVSDVPSDAERGIGKRQGARARKLAELGADVQAELKAELKEQGKAITPDALLALQRKRNKTEKKRTLAAAGFSAEGPFDSVVIDPPWDVEKIDRDVRPNQHAFDYPTMTVEQIEAFWRTEIEPRLKDDCHVFMWTTHKYLPAAIGIIERLSLRYVLTMVWRKAGGFQPIDLPQYNCEFVVYARRGKPLFIDTKDFFCCFDGERREHSRKPDTFYDTVRRVTGGSRIDVFSREAREGFAQYGNETAKFAGAA
jgi:N6-adenosine-specific RNA methylase IME4